MTMTDQLDRRVAIIGMAGRFPGAGNTEQLWQLLTAAEEGITSFTDDDLAAAGLRAPVFEGDNYVRASGKLSDIDKFDAAFFGYSSKQAADLDPQQRIFLECAWEALEDAACDPQRFDGSIGVFAGAGANRYALEELVSDLQNQRFIDLMQRTLSSDKDFLSTRVSYKLNLRGPSLTLQTACSTSLVAVHLARQSLLNGECDIAIAGGVNIHLPHGVGYTYTEGGILARDGHCRAFDADANGTVPASGAGVVVLRRLDQARSAHNHIYAVVLNSAINNDGASKVGYTAPSVDGQRAVLEAALQGIEPRSIGMIEAHGTGTVLGDAIELTALTEVFGARESARAPCALGSIKSNIGHLDAAAGIAGLMKAALCLKHRQLVPSLHLRQPHPLLDTPDSPFALSTALRDWPAGDTPRRAGVSSFGMGGTNAHIILEEPPLTSSGELGASSEYLFVLSAKTPNALAAARHQLARFVRQHPAVPLSDIAYTLQTGRSQFGYRQAIVASSHAGLIAALERDHRAPVSVVDAAAVVYVFAPAAGERVSVLQKLYNDDAQWHSAYEECARILRACAGIGIGIGEQASELSPSATGAVKGVDWTSYVSQYCSARMLISRGIAPAVLAGSGIGELIAACVAGVFSFETCVRIVCAAHAIDPVGALATVLSTVEFSQPSCPLLSSADGVEPSTGDLLDVQYWRRRLGDVAIEAAPADVLGGTEALLVPCASAALDDFFDKHFLNENGLAHAGLLSRTAGALWLRGAILSGTAAPDTPHPYLTRLPSYPFERESFWLACVPEQSQESEPVHSIPETASVADDAPKFYLPLWKASPDPRLNSAAARLEKGVTWLVVGDGGAMEELITGQLRAAGADVVTVRLGKRYERRGGDCFVTSTAQADDMNRMVDELLERKKIVRYIVYCVPHSPAEAGGEVARYWDRQTAGYLGVTRLAQALASNGRGAELAIAIVTRRLSADLQHVIEPADETVTSLPPIFAREWPHVTTRVIDIPAFDVAEGARYAQWICAELTGAATEALIAYRSGRRLVRGFDVQALDAVVEAPHAVRRHGVYLLTGGMGTIGLTLAETLARQYQARMILLGRHAFPERAQWDSLLEHGTPSDPILDRIRKIQVIEALGGKVAVIAADVADDDSLSSAIAQGERELGTINGIIHLAASLDDASVQVQLDKLTSAQLERQARPKVEGAFALEKVFAGRELDFCVLFSSNASILGGTGFGAYAAANAALDALAHGERRCGTRSWLALNWDGWTVQGNALDGAPSITPDEGAGALLQALALCGVPQIIISKSNFAARFAASTRKTAAMPPAPAPLQQAAGASAAQPAPDADVAAPTELESVIAQIWEKNLGINGIGLRDDFFELGGDSLVLLGITASVTEMLHVDVPMRDYLHFGMTVDGFSKAIVAHLTKLHEGRSLRDRPGTGEVPSPR